MTRAGRTARLPACGGNSCRAAPLTLALSGNPRRTAQGSCETGTQVDSIGRISQRHAFSHARSYAQGGIPGSSVRCGARSLSSIVPAHTRLAAPRSPRLSPCRLPQLFL